MLVNGKWTEAWQPVQASDGKGGFLRLESKFRNWVTADGSPGPSGEGGFPAAAGRYHLYVSLACPWACRTLMVRRLKRLEAVISVLVVQPAMTDQGWQFGDYPGADRDTLNGATCLHEIYTSADPRYTGRVTVPVLWDRKRRSIVNNESSEIVRMLNGAFSRFTDGTPDLYPPELAAEIDALNERVYTALNNGVYRAGFATTQAAYEEAYHGVFAMLDELEQRLHGRTFLVGERLTETDIRTFVTLVRFDNAYHGLFKCNRQRLADYPNLSGYVARILAIEGVGDTVNVDHIKKGYYAITALNPGGIVPCGPQPALPGDAAA